MSMPMTANAKGALQATRGDDIDFTDPAQNLKSFVRMSGDIDPSKETSGLVWRHHFLGGGR